MRPQSEIRVDLSAALVDGPGTTRELAQRTGWSIGLTMIALRNMVSAGDARKEFRRVPGVCRPVPVYHRAVRAADQVGATSSGIQSLIAAWAAIPASLPMEAAM
jgi:hypothetical protein